MFQSGAHRVPPVCRGLFFHLTFKKFSLLLLWIAKTLKTAYICDQQLTFVINSSHLDSRLHMWPMEMQQSAPSDLTLLLLFWSNRHIITWPLRIYTHVWNIHIFGNGLFSVFLYSYEKWSGSCTWIRTNTFIIKTHYLNRVSGSCRLSCKCSELQVRSTSTFHLRFEQHPLKQKVKVK